ncbi:uncharacterized protein PV06_06100 [Exophiala oligosperma]|uniref:Mis12-Mtw1 family protein n=1 Tax=Exophiala oligosperma TaxID=215243 RepID=A0A0D2ARR7_9EURO|nr:uncharacterized protein PV06_06100 [Exophiala oligosperma]KIW42561.1 hypothetical protein PV06_06100 [Exophiala oligosperma]
MTALVARQPLQPLPMSATQRPSRRLSARVQDKDDAVTAASAQINGNARMVGSTSRTSRTQGARGGNEKKRKIDYDEEDDGFMFRRVKSKPEPKVTTEKRNEHASEEVEPQRKLTEEEPIQKSEEQPIHHQQPTKRANRLSFSTPGPKEQTAVRRSKRLSGDKARHGGSPSMSAHPKARRKSKETRAERPREEPPKELPAQREPQHSRQSPKRAQATASAETQPSAQNKEMGTGPSDIPSQIPSEHEDTIRSAPHEDHSATKISLPFADTPVIKRNKAMREGKSGKGERRSSLGLRGRRASSLIESGNSNALPHKEVEIPDFYKHIESEGLPEPRRMRQLLTWCATRALDEKPMGTDFEDSSARSAARVIQEELLKDLSNESKLSDWFTREDEPVQRKPLPQRPNPKNIQNMEKIAELEEQIKRLRSEKEALENLLRRPPISNSDQIQESIKSNDNNLDQRLLSETDITALDSLPATSTSSDQVSKCLNRLYDSLGPTIDQFADGIHTIGQYRQAADNVASRALAICAERLSRQENEGRKKALPDAQGTPPKDLGGVLRSLSRAER